MHAVFKYGLPSLLGVLFSTVVLAAKTVVIDVRTPAEYAETHVPGALNIEFQNIGREISKAGVDKGDKVILYCRSGARASNALQTLQSMGYTDVHNYGGVDEARTKLSPK